LTDLIGEPVTRSDAFRFRWASHNVRHHRVGLKRVHHPLVGDLELHYEAMELPSDPGWQMFAFTAEPNSGTMSGSNSWPGWAATLDNETSALAAPQWAGQAEPSPRTPHPRQR
jgi:hypothetical protein